MRIQALVPRYPVPALNVALTTGGRFVLGASPGDKRSVREWGLYVSALRGKTSLGMTSLLCSASPACLSSGRTALFTTAPCRPCLLLGPPFKTCWEPSTSPSPSPKTTQHAVSTRARFDGLATDRCVAHRMNGAALSAGSLFFQNHQSDSAQNSQ